jgi:hypothetical protein
VLRVPTCAALWLPHHEGWVDGPPKSFDPERSLRFRSRLRHLPVSGELRVLELTPGRVRLRLRIGLLAFDARFSVGAEPCVPGAARIGLVLTLANEVALVGGSLDRFAVRKLASEIAETTLAAIAAVAEDEERAARSA